MKKVLFSLAILLVSNLAFAQLSKGSLLVTGAASAYKGSYNGQGTSSSFLLLGPYTRTSFSIAPQVMYFLSNRFAIGVSGSYSELNYESKDENLNSSYVYSSNSHRNTIGQLIRYNIPLRQNFYLYLQEGALFYSGKGEYKSFSSGSFGSNNTITNPYNLTGYSIIFKTGIQYFLSNRVAVDVSVDLLNYTTQKEKYETETDTYDEFEINLVPNSVTLGISYRFGGTGN